MTPTELWRQNLGRARAVVIDQVRRIPAGRGIVEDLIQSASMGLWIAANKYQEVNNGTQNASFFTYAYLRVKGEVMKEIYRNHLLGFKAAERNIRVSVCEVQDDRADVPDSVYEDKELLDYIIDRLEIERWKAIARRLWIQQLPHATVAHQFGVSEAGLHQVLFRIKKRMKLIAEELREEWEG